MPLDITKDSLDIYAYCLSQVRGKMHSLCDNNLYSRHPFYKIAFAAAIKPFWKADDFTAGVNVNFEDPVVEAYIQQWCNLYGDHKRQYSLKEMCTYIDRYVSKWEVENEILLKLDSKNQNYVFKKPWHILNVNQGLANTTKNYKVCIEKTKNGFLYYNGKDTWEPVNIEFMVNLAMYSKLHAPDDLYRHMLRYNRGDLSALLDRLKNYYNVRNDEAASGRIDKALYAMAAIAKTHGLSEVLNMVSEIKHLNVTDNVVSTIAALYDPDDTSFKSIFAAMEPAIQKLESTVLTYTVSCDDVAQLPDLSL